METKANRKDIIEIIAHVSKTRVETGHVKLWKQSQKSKQKRTGNESVWKNGKRSNERKRTNLKEQKWVWSGNPGGTCYCDVFFLFVFFKSSIANPASPTRTHPQNVNAPPPVTALASSSKGRMAGCPSSPPRAVPMLQTRLYTASFTATGLEGTCSKKVKVPVQLMT